MDDRIPSYAPRRNGRPLPPGAPPDVDAAIVNAPPVVATVQIAMLADGSVHCHFQGADRNIFNLMVETARQDMLEKFKEQEAQARGAIIPAPLGVTF